MRNVTMSVDASFHRTPLSWAKKDLPISLPWRSTLWRTSVPILWVLSWAAWIWVMSVDTTGRNLILYGLLVIGLSAMLAISAVWWIGLFLNRRQAGTLVISDDYLEWQFETGSNVDLLSDCGAFAVVGKRNADLRIEWDSAASWDGGGAWPRWVSQLFQSDHALYARDLGLDRSELERLCKLLNQLREEAGA